MRWSFSAHSSFRRCPRQWFYRQLFANARAKAPARIEAYRLSKLEGLQAWRGKIVDSVISDAIIPSIVRKRPYGLEEAKRKADELFSCQRAERLARNGNTTFFEVEYGLPLTEELFEVARSDIHAALENFYEAEPVWRLFQEARSLVAQRPLAFAHDAANVRVVPDLITFQNGGSPAVLDWKVNRYPLRDYWLQLVTGAIAVTRCTPHRDWPNGVSGHSPEDVQLLEVQLLAGDVRIHNLSETDVQEAEDFISVSASEMELACGGSKPKDLKPEDFPAAADPRTCQTCALRKVCWGSGE